jgi:hypothetical protein
MVHRPQAPTPQQPNIFDPVPDVAQVRWLAGRHQADMPGQRNSSVAANCPAPRMTSFREVSTLLLVQRQVCIALLEAPHH